MDEVLDRFDKGLCAVCKKHLKEVAETKFVKRLNHKILICQHHYVGEENGT